MLEDDGCLQDDSMWEYALNAKLSAYLPKVREFWEHIDDIDVMGTGVYPVLGDDVPTGLMYRVTSTPARSPIKNVQVFPFVPSSYLNFTNVRGGAVRMVSRVCAGGRFTMDEFTIVEKSNLPATYHQGQIVAFVPTAMLEAGKALGRWVYLTANELMALAQGKVLTSIKGKAIKRL